jgi:signal transduction histidine kinase/ligand-binding sensor domain-containing protein/CheY-like chemotaxis protein
MRVLYSKPLITVLLLLISTSLFGHDPSKKIAQYTLSSWTTEEGLPQNTVSSIVQTKDGYLWFGTQEGVARLNGEKFTVFNRSTTDAFKFNWVQAMAEDRNGTLWLGTQGGGLISYREGQFRGYTTKDGLPSNRINWLLEDSTGNLWIGSEAGLSEFANGKFVNRFGTDELSHGNILRVVQDTSGDIWLIQDQKLKLLRNGVPATAEIPQALRDLKEVSTVYADHEGGLWVGAVHQGLLHYHNGRISHYGKEAGLPDPEVDVIYEDNAKNVWIGTASGLCRLNNHSLECFSMKVGLSGQRVMSIYEDREGSLWVGTESGGVNRFKEGPLSTYGAASGLKASVVWSVAVGKNGNVWLGTDTGIKLLQPDGNIVQPLKSPRANANTSSILEDREGNIWISRVSGGVTEFIKNEDFRPHDFSAADGLAPGLIRALYQDRSGNIWFGADNGGATRYRDGKFVNFTAKEGLAGNRVWCILEDRNGALWFGQDGSLTRMFDGKFSSFAVPEDDDPNSLTGTPAQVVSIYEDADGALWLGTYSAGLRRFKDGKFTTLSTRDGMLDDNIWSILEDSRGYLWMSSNLGIFRAKRSDLNDFADGKVRRIEGTSYGTADGMLSTDCAGGLQPTASQSPDGRIFFGCVRGLVVADPSELAANPLPPPVQLEQVMINNVRRSSENVRASAGRGELEFHFAALSYRSPSKVKFKYKLEGFDQSWISAGNRRVAYYTNIPPGQYKFHVVAANEDGVWNEQGASFSFYLVPPFYQTWWFRLLALLAMAGFTVGSIRLRVRQIRRKEYELKELVRNRTRDLQIEVEKHKQTESELQQEVVARISATEKAEAAAKSKSEFLANMSHEIRTPLNGVMGMLELVRQTELTSEQKELLSLAHDSAGALLSIINDILDFSKIEAGKLEFEQSEFDLRDTIAEATRTMAVHAHAKKLSLSYYTSPDAPVRICGDALRLKQVLVNLLGNAVKFTKEGQILLQVGLEQMEDDRAVLRFSVSDTGVGIPMEKQLSIFDAFSQADNSVTRRFGGTGLGLAICRRIVKMMDGRIWVESEINKGSTFFFTASFALPAGAQQSMKTGSALRRHPVLLSENNETDRKMLQQLLSSWGMQVLADAAVGQSASPLLISDYDTAAKSEFQEIRDTKARWGARARTIVLLTSDDYHGNVRRCRELGVDAHVMKPVKPSELLDAIQSVLNPTLDTLAEAPAALDDSERKLRILLAEDNLVNQKLAIRMLEKMGHEVLLAPNGKVAVQKSQQETFDLILMDVHMPEMDGYAATAMIREWERRRGGHVPIIALTAGAMAGDRELCLKSGMDGYLSKPIDIKELKQTLARAATGDVQRDAAPAELAETPANS